VAAQGQTTQPAPVTSTAPLPGAHPGANADTPPPAVPGVPRPGDSAGPESVPLAPVHTMAPRPLPSDGAAPGGTPPGGTGPNLDPNAVPGRPVTNVRALAAHRTATGYVLGGQAQVSDGCQAARFDAVGRAASPSAFALVQYRNPANRGVMCTQMVRWVPASRTVTTAKPPTFVTVRTAAGTKRVPVR
jgi:hypothetical protein